MKEEEIVLGEIVVDKWTKRQGRITAVIQYVEQTEKLYHFESIEGDVYDKWKPACVFEKKRDGQ